MPKKQQIKAKLTNVIRIVIKSIDKSPTRNQGKNSKNKWKGNKKTLVEHSQIFYFDKNNENK
jgi:hypothetical protein